MRFRKKREPADPFAVFSERHGFRRPPRYEPEEPREPEAEPEAESKDAPEPVSWAHRILGVDLDSTPREITAAYRKLARKYHPDVAGNEERMKQINIAYAELRR